MQELLNIKQTAGVQDYYDRFTLVMHRVLVHNNHLDDVFFVSKFLQGLQPDIRAALILHKPRTVDAALSLALMQAEVIDAQQKPYTRRPNREFIKHPGKFPLTAEPGVLGAIPPEATKPKWETQMANLRAQRRAQGLCMKCGEKWGRNHKCPDKISLHVLEELLAIMPMTLLKRMITLPLIVQVMVKCLPCRIVQRLVFKARRLYDCMVWLRIVKSSFSLIQAVQDHLSVLPRLLSCNAQ